MISESLINRLHRHILFRETINRTELYAPVHGLTLSLVKSGMLRFGDRSISLNHFLDQQSPCADENLRMLQQAFLVPPAPFSKINISLTEACTLTCPHCFLGHKKSPAKSNFDLDIIKRISAFKPSEISLTGGEVFLINNLESVISEIVNTLENRPLIRILANGSWIYNQDRINGFLRYLEELDVDIQFRFTLFHHNPEIHDSICGSAGHLDTLSGLIRDLRKKSLKFSVNFPITSFSVRTKDDTLSFLEDLTAGAYTISSIIYPSEHGYRDARKISLSENQFASLLDDLRFRPLASAYCDSSDQCRYHCRFPLVDTDGTVFHCNLPGATIINGISANVVFREKKMCSNCDAQDWCKKCPSAVPEFSVMYCPLSRIAAKKVKADYKSALDSGFSLITVGVRPTL